MRFDGIISSQIRKKFSALMVSLDKGVQQLTEALRSKGMYDNTIFIFTGDNGGWFKISQFGTILHHNAKRSEKCQRVVILKRAEV